MHMTYLAFDELLDMINAYRGADKSLPGERAFVDAYDVAQFRRYRNSMVRKPRLLNSNKKTHRLMPDDGAPRRYYARGWPFVIYVIHGTYARISPEFDCLLGMIPMCHMIYGSKRL